MSHYWTTIGRTIYYPASVVDPWTHVGVLEHELVHVQQWQRWNVLFWVTYLFVPLPLGFAWFRWRWEREAYLVDLHRASDQEHAVERIVDSLWTGYAWPWPKPWMRRWFLKRIVR